MIKKYSQLAKQKTITLYRGLSQEFNPSYDQMEPPHGYSCWTDNPLLARQYAGEGGGQIVRIVRKNGITEHYGLKASFGYLDGYGCHSSAQEWLQNYTREEDLPNAEYSVLSGIDKESGILSDIETSLKIANLWN